MSFLSFFKKQSAPMAEVKNLPSHERIHTIDILARTLWGEARGESEDGIKAVASVILNRARHAQLKGSFWWGNDITQVCLKPYQFSCWNKNDPNYPKLLAVTTTTPSYSLAVAIATQAVDGHLRDITGGATHYHTTAILPYWARGEKAVSSIGRHLFYRLV